MKVLLNCTLVGALLLVPGVLADIIAVDHGTGAPPAALGPYAIEPLPVDTRATYTDVSNAPGDPPLTGPVRFSLPMSLRQIGSGWATWSHGYGGVVYYSNGATEATLYLPTGTAAFLLYVEPNPFSLQTVTATADDGTFITREVNGDSGASGFGFYGTGGTTLTSITVTGSSDFAWGEFYGQTCPTGSIVAVDHGTGAPPAALGPFDIDPLPFDPRSIFSDVTSAPGNPPLTGPVDFSIPMSLRQIGSGWATWSHGYTGVVYYTGGATSATMTLPPGTAAFLMYIEPEPFSLQTIIATADDGTFIERNVQGDSGAAGFGFYGTGGRKIVSITVTGTTDFAWGEFYGAVGPDEGIIAVDHGTGAPPATLGPYAIEPLPFDGRSVFTDVSDAPGVPPLTGDVTFSLPMSLRQIGSGWATWSHGYGGVVYYSNGATDATMDLPEGTKAFLLYVEPNPFSLQTVTAIADDGTSITREVNGDSGAAGFGFYGTCGRTLTSIRVTGSSDFAWGEFYAAGEPCAADIDGDGDTDLSDLAALLASYNLCAGDAGYEPGADYDDSGCVDLSDLAFLLANYLCGT